MSSRVVVVGAGVGGLAAAIDLARAGHRVTLTERFASPGGKMREAHVAGRAIDVGPTVLTMRWVFDELFQDAGLDLDDRLDLTPATTLARHVWSPSEILELYADPERSHEAIAAFAGTQEARGYARFRKRAKEMYNTLESSFIRAPRPTAIGLVRRSGGLGGLLTINPFETLWRELGRYFADPRLRQLFGRYATYCGSSPFEAPATLMLIAHVELDGVWTIRGGMHQLARAMADLAQALGVSTRYRSQVTELTLNGDKLSGVVVNDDHWLEADAVVVNADPSALASGCFGDRIATRFEPLDRAKRSNSALTWAMLAKADGLALRRHNVFFGRDYPAEFAELRAGLIPRDPTVYVCCQDRSDTEPNPSGAERLFMIMNAPADGDRNRRGADELETHRRVMLGALRRRGLELVTTGSPEVVTTPSDYAHDFPGVGGALYGAATHGSRASFQRPSARTRVEGLYLAGGGCHPGAGVPNSTLSGRLAAQAVIEDLAPRRRGFDRFRDRHPPRSR
ncbi:MAG: 1-hydroxycarotenoid 3,4-desaturase CrtD [Myxococcota bacterium]